jgi:hypothetical protein
LAARITSNDADAVPPRSSPDCRSAPIIQAERVVCQAPPRSGRALARLWRRASGAQPFQKFHQIRLRAPAPFAAQRADGGQRTIRVQQGLRVPRQGRFPIGRGSSARAAPGGAASSLLPAAPLRGFPESSAGAQLRRRRPHGLLHGLLVLAHLPRRSVRERCALAWTCLAERSSVNAQFPWLKRPIGDDAEQGRGRFRPRAPRSP